MALISCSSAMSQLSVLLNVDIGIGGGRALPPLARPGAGEAAEQEEKAEHADENRQHADAAHDAGVGHLQADPAVACVGVAGAHREDARHIEAAAVVEAARQAA